MPDVRKFKKFIAFKKYGMNNNIIKLIHLYFDKVISITTLNLIKSLNKKNS